jgi:hypothetical protein
MRTGTGSYACTEFFFFPLDPFLCFLHPTKSAGVQKIGRRWDCLDGDSMGAHIEPI